MVVERGEGGVILMDGLKPIKGKPGFYEINEATVVLLQKMLDSEMTLKLQLATHERERERRTFELRRVLEVWTKADTEKLLGRML